MTFSIIVPVYNVEKYLSKCLDSILNQSFQDFEIIVVNDGSPDNSQDIIDEYAKNYPEKIKPFIKENGGLSDARNFGIERANGDYLLFVDSDDYISPSLLSELQQAQSRDNADLIRFSAQAVFENGELGEIYYCPEMSAVDGLEAISRLIDNKQMFEPAWLYAYRRHFWMENEFSFAKGRYHEDFGLTPEIIVKAKSFSAISSLGYFYVQSAISIMRGVSYEKKVSKANDILFHSLNHIKTANTLIDNIDIKNKLLSYVANASINQIDNLKNPERSAYIDVVKKEKIFDLLLQDTLKRRMKKIYIKLKYGAYK